jgi:large subunit ribosomal protein L17
MKHGKKFNHLKRKAGHRKALLRNLSAALIEHKRINTTLAKAKALRKYMEPLVTKAKEDSTHARRMVFRALQNKDAVTELFGPIAVKIGDRPGGYLRVIKTGFRRSDSAEMAMIEFVDYNEIYEPSKSQDSGSRRRRRRRGGSGSSGGEGAATAATAATAAAASSTVGEEEE